MDLMDEARRQQGLVEALLRGGSLGLPTQESATRTARALSAYRANVHASAERALAGAYPTVRELLGEPAFAQLAGALWEADPPRRGDLGLFGETLPPFIAVIAQLAEWPYLADVASLDWAVHVAESAADGSEGSPDLRPMAVEEPARLALRLSPGCALIASDHPVVTIRAAHRERSFDAARAALAEGRGERAFVARRGWAVEVCPLAPAEARFTAAVLDGHSLAAALDRAGAEFDFEAWLTRALRAGWLAGVETLPPS